MASTDCKSLLKSDSLYKYILDTTVYPCENPYMRELRLATHQHPLTLMISLPDEAQFLNLLLKILNAKNTLEIGVFTGYSLLATALALPDDGKIIAIDVNREFYEVGRPIIEKAGMAGKIDFRKSPALPILDQLVSEEKNIGKFDFAFIDADKANYPDYHERLLKLVRIGGIIAYDNTLWCGTVVAPPDEIIPGYMLLHSPSPPRHCQAASTGDAPPLRQPVLPSSLQAIGSLSLPLSLNLSL